MNDVSRDALEGLIEEFVTREGTDYGAEETTLDERKSALRRKLERKEVLIVFDPATETCNLIAREDLER